jgi:uncharacterized protein YabE (DUF348 family)
MAVLPTEGFTGTAEAGKSTVLKQMQLMHKNGFSDSEREYYQPIVNSNIAENMKIVLEQMKVKQRRFSLEENEVKLRTSLNS